MRTIPAGTRVRLLHDEDRYPHFIAEEGMTGTVVSTGVSNIQLAVLMDRHIPGAETWANELHWFDIEEFDPWDHVQPLREDMSPAIIGAILNVQSAIRLISKFGSNQDIAGAVLDLQRAVRYLKGDQTPD